MTKKEATVHKYSEVTPLISVVLPLYNGEKYISSAIESILSQSFNEFELIVLDDGSTDDSLAIVERHAKKDKRIKVISRKNKGLPATLNEAISVARGWLIARMDQDDLSMSNRLECQYEFMCQHPEVVALGSSATFIDKNGSSICNYIPPSDDAALRDSFPNSPFVHPSVVFRKDAFFEAGKYPEHMKLGGEDVVLFGRLAKLGELRNLSDPLINYRLVPGSMSRKPPKFRHMLTNILIEEIEGRSDTAVKLMELYMTDKKITKSQALFDYNFELAKLCTWSGSAREKKMLYLKECRSFRKMSVKVFFMYFLSNLPAAFVKPVFYALKRRRYESCNASA